MASGRRPQRVEPWRPLHRRARQCRGRKHRSAILKIRRVGGRSAATSLVRAAQARNTSTATAVTFNRRRTPLSPVVVYWSPAQRLSNEPDGTSGCAPLISPAVGTALATCGACALGVGAVGASDFCDSTFCGSDLGVSTFAVTTLRGAAAGFKLATVVACGAGCGAASLFGLNSRAKKPSLLELVVAEATWLVFWLVP